MPDFTSVPTVELLTRAADAAGRAVAECEAEGPDDSEVGPGEMYRTLRGVGCQPGSARMLAASGPDHWRAVEGLLRAQMRLHSPAADGEHCHLCIWVLPKHPFPCPTLQALRPLTEQVLRDLGEA